MFSCEDGDAELAAAQQWILPSIEFHGIWETLIYESNIKAQVIQNKFTIKLQNF